MPSTQFEFDWASLPASSSGKTCPVVSVSTTMPSDVSSEDSLATTVQSSHPKGRKRAKAAGSGRGRKTPAHTFQSGRAQVTLWDRKEHWRGESSTLSIMDWPRDANVCSLSQVLVTGSIPRKYFLTSKACSGILRRAEKRGKSLPPSLHAALQAVASGQTSTAMEVSSLIEQPFEVANCLTQRMYKGINTTIDEGENRCLSFGDGGVDTSPTLDANMDRKWGSNQWVDNGFAVIAPLTSAGGGNGVRRLLPVEYEKLMGMPPGWTLVPYRGKPAKDGPRYKSIGNSWAVPCVSWIAKRIDTLV